ncbi:hypothetical protein P691DRAFT_765000 [Macrolepiota fuliginosa MF-IS2]|uniref:Uncharacterized protein n=1 Tax=Macrolepiota fuliginosa MF-IS2 TaxID=1400762 RepID=A0A9P5X2X1_9AGAR|nr:hypothetical protein P691DRAFT_765000 [Macrolepiota fuliginosa MF-IS2]
MAHGRAGEHSSDHMAPNIHHYPIPNPVPMPTPGKRPHAQVSRSPARADTHQRRNTPPKHTPNNVSTPQPKRLRGKDWSGILSWSDNDDSNPNAEDEDVFGNLNTTPTPPSTTRPPRLSLHNTLDTPLPDTESQEQP